MNDSHQKAYTTFTHTTLVAHAAATGILGLVQTARVTNEEYRNFRTRVTLIDSGCEIDLNASIARRDGKVSVDACVGENDRPLDEGTLNKVLELLLEYYPGGSADCDNGFDISLSFPGY